MDNPQEIIRDLMDCGLSHDEAAAQAAVEVAERKASRAKMRVGEHRRRGPFNLNPNMRRGASKK